MTSYIFWILGIMLGYSVCSCVQTKRRIRMLKEHAFNLEQTIAEVEHLRESQRSLEDMLSRSRAAGDIIEPPGNIGLSGDIIKGSE